MKHLKLIKLMYLVDREAFKRWGHPITGDRYVSMQFGPVLSNSLDLLRGDATDCWKDFIEESAPHTVKLLQECGTDRLSEAEEDLAHEIFATYGTVSRWDLVKLTHTFKEYKETDNDNRRWPIENIDILRAVGKSQDEAESIQKHLDAVTRAKSLLKVG